LPRFEYKGASNSIEGAMRDNSWTNQRGAWKKEKEKEKEKEKFLDGKMAIIFDRYETEIYLESFKCLP
jgi:hypothetical protein